MSGSARTPRAPHRDRAAGDPPVPPGPRGAASARAFEAPPFAEPGRLGASRITFGHGPLLRTLGHVRAPTEELRGA